MTRMRVCHVMSADLWAGAEVQLATTAAYLARQPDISVTAVLFNEGRLAFELRRLGLDVVVLDEQRLNAFRILGELTRFLKARRFDLVHTHRYKDSVLGAVAAKLAGVPYVVRTVHGLREPMTGWQQVKFRAYETLDKITLQCLADLVIAVSKRMARTLREGGYRPTMVTDIHNGIELSRVVPRRARSMTRRELGADDRTLLIGAVGRLAPVKDHAMFLDAARLIRQARPAARFVIAGDGPLEGDLRARVAALNLQDACVLTGARDDVYDVTSAFDIFVLPSLDEGIPMALLEAMALGRPVVATAVGGVPEVVDHDVSGLLVPAGDARALADACLRIGTDPLLARRLGNGARRAAETAFSQEHIGRALVEAYHSVAAIPKGPEAPPAAEGFGRPVEPVTPMSVGRELVRTAAARGARKVRYALERRRMRRVRRNPSVLADRVRAARRILIVCHGNIIRSPFAASLLRNALGDRHAITVASAGLEAMPGGSPHPLALHTAAGLQVDLSRHSAAPVSPAQVADSDLIFVMDVPLLAAMRDRFPNAASRTFLLACLAPDTPLEVRDPVDGDGPVFQACFDHISRAVNPVVGMLSAHGPRP